MQTLTHAPIKPDIALTESAMQGLPGLLAKLLADEYVLQTRLRNYHWNVTGPQFAQLHELFEQQYDQLAEVIDDAAERIRQYGAMAPGTLTEFLALSRLQEAPGVYPGARTMVLNLVADHEAIIRSLRADIITAGEQYGDVATEDFMTGVLQMHQKMAWFLRAFVEGESI